ncbi:unnamed protein product [Rotaria magnacalcarata]|uniref:TIR domain-containing protein n=2 Tax=Rotaria magnacalcarata TaxID=392030 RepID=A0A816N4N2_9BILA|nr:unnamed protein product [Rotaria magnacalcarata]CAF2109053.1 unnamed protein product [Rotaria magnacalcarata]CAF4303440.1 unnamed protein product [Rotaria magnacalcarata]CAF4359337.1 unnamed protein product [Rotaria magnacalcarata]
MDIGEMGGGSELSAKIAIAIRGAKVIVCFMNKAHAQLNNCIREVNLCVSIGKPLIPLLLEKLAWPPEGALDSIMSEYLYIRFYDNKLNTINDIPLEVTHPQIMISYQWDHQADCVNLYKQLTQLNYQCWLDIFQIGSSDSLFEKIDDGIRNAKCMLSCATLKYTKSLNCRREVCLVDALGKTIIPLLLEDTDIWSPPGPMVLVFAE